MKNFKKKQKSTNLGVLTPETNSWGDLVEIHQKIVQIGALAATFWAKQKIEKKQQCSKKNRRELYFLHGDRGGGIVGPPARGASMLKWGFWGTARRRARVAANSL